MLEYHAEGAELQKIPEFSTAHKPLALQARLIQGGEALKSTNIDLPDLKPDSLIAQWQTSRTATLNKLSHVVTKEQHRVWADDTEKRKKAGTTDVETINKLQVEDWSNKMVVFFGKPERKKNLDILQNVHFGGIDYGNFSQNTAKLIYQKYMIDRDEMGESGNEILVIGKEIELPANMVRFINDALRAHLTDPKTVDFAELEKNLEAIKTLALIFGKPSAEIIDNTLKGIISVFKNVESRKEFAAQANERKPVIDEKGDLKETSRQNYLYSGTNNEKGLLEWLNDESNVETKVVQAKAVAAAVPLPFEKLPEKNPLQVEIDKDGLINIGRSKLDGQGKSTYIHIVGGSGLDQTIADLEKVKKLRAEKSPDISTSLILTDKEIDHVLEQLHEYQKSLTAPKSGEYTAEEMTKFVQAQETLIDLVKQPENRKQQDLVLEKLPELFDQLPVEFRWMLTKQDFLLTLAGMRPMTAYANLLDVASYDQKKFDSLNGILEKMFGVRTEVNVGKPNKLGEKSYYNFVIYNPASLQSYTQNNNDICLPYDQSRKFYDWYEDYIKSDKHDDEVLFGYPRSSIEDRRRGKTRTKGFGSENGKFYAEKKHADIELHEKARIDFVKKWLQIEADNKKLDGTSPEMLEATKAWRIFIGLDQKIENLPPTQTPLDTFYKERFEKINSRLDLLKRKSKLAQDPQKNASEILQLDQQLTQLEPETIKAQIELFAFEDVVLSELFGLSMHEINNDDRKKAAYEEHLLLPMLSFLDAFYRRDVQAAEKSGSTLKAELKPTLSLLGAKIDYEEEQFVLLIANHTRIAEAHA